MAGHVAQAYERTLRSAGFTDTVGNVSKLFRIIHTGSLASCLESRLHAARAKIPLHSAVTALRIMCCVRTRASEQLSYDEDDAHSSG